jgi:transposase-like protein
MSEADERSEQDGGQRGRPGRRSVQDRHNAVLEVLQGKATVDQVARRLGVRPETVVGWREAALEGMTAALQRGDGPSARERELELENGTLRDALTRSAMQVELLQRELGIPARGPSPRRRSRR